MSRRKIRKIVNHCSASAPRMAKVQTAKDIDRMHRLERKWRKIGYHYFVRYDGKIEKGRDEAEVGAGVFGHNADAIHICYAGGLDEKGRAADTRSDAQKAALATLNAELLMRYTSAEVYGHRDLSPDKDGDGKVEKQEWLKACPCFDAPAEYGRGRGA